MAEQDTAVTQDEESGLSAEEQDEIRGYIDELASKQRVSLAETSEWQAPIRGRDRRLPLLVNGVVILLLFVATLVGFSLFSNAEQSVGSLSGTFQTAEGALIAELRRQTTSELEQKDQEITSIREELSEITVERDQILAEIDARVEAREAELLRALADELREERIRLEGEGLSESRITEFLAALEAERRIQIREEVTALRTELEQEFSSALEELQLLQQELRDQLRSLQNERLQIRSQAVSREQELLEEASQQAQVAPAAQPAATAPPAPAQPASTATEDAVAQARAELAEIEEAQEREALLLAQLRGIKERIETEIAGDRIEEAAASVQVMRALLASPDTAAILSDAQRDGDLRLAAALDQLLLQLQLDGGTVEAASVLQTVERVDQFVSEARLLLGQGSSELAEQRYRTALNLIPEAAEGHLFLLETQRAEVTSAVTDEVAAAFEVRIQELEQQLAAAEASAAAAADEAQARIADRTSADVLNAEALAAANARVQELEQELVQAREDLTNAQATIARAQEARLEAVSRAEGRIATLEERLAAAQESAVATGDDDAAETIAQLRAQLASAQNAAERSAVTRQELAGQIDALEGTVGGLREDVVRLAAFEEEYQALRERYREYVAAEEAALASESILRLAQARVELNSFLDTAEVDAVFPAFYERIERYNIAFEAEGRQAAILDAIDLVLSVSQFDSLEDQQAFLREEERALSQDDPLLADLAAELSFLLELE